MSLQHINWNHYFIWKQKTEAILQNQQTATKVGTKLVSNHMWAE